MRRLLLAVLGLLALAGCSTYHPAVVQVQGAGDVQPQAISICVDQNGVHVPDDYCSIGYQTGLSNAGYVHEFYAYPPGATDVVIPYVGYRVAGPGWTRTVPPNITTINIHPSGDVAPARAPAGSKATSADVPISPKTSASSTVTRGGLGVGATAKPVTQAGAGSYTAPKPGPVKRVIAAVRSKVTGGKR